MPLAVVTVMVTVPFFTPLTTPLALTVAMPGSELIQVQLPAEPAGVTLILSDSFSFLPFFTLYPCQRYDLQGKAVLKTQEKYYLSDISLKYGQLGFDNKMIASMLENIVFLEMKRRGYEVYIGKIGSKEIDFIGILRDEKVYVQVCRTIPEDSDRETENLKEIRDHYHKYVVAMDKLAIGNDEGIAFVHIADFLLMDKW